MSFLKRSIELKHSSGLLLLISSIIIFSACQGSKQTTVKTIPSEAELEKQKIEELRFERKKNWSFGGGAYLQKNYDDALKYLLKAKEIDMLLDPEKSEYPLIYKYLSGTYQQIGDFDKALGNLEIFFMYDKEDPSTNESLIWHYQRTSKLDKFEKQILHYLPPI